MLNLFLSHALPFLQSRPPRIVDWLPWNHVFGGSHNFNMMLANGGSLYVDEGKPAPHLVGLTVENNRLMSATMAFNVPIGYAQLRDVMRTDAGLRSMNPIRDPQRARPKPPTLRGAC